LLLKLKLKMKTLNPLKCLVVFAMCAFVFPMITVVISKEIEATKEWQIIGENDTIPSGAHVRMDMTTGEKWVKLLDKNEENREVTTSSVEIGSDGKTSSAVVVGDPKESQNNAATDKEAQDTYDYDMMHRTLSKLPEEERERMGGLPELPGDEVGTASKKDRNLFEKRMKEIWEKRQEELANFQEEHLADLPKLLMERIKRMKAYLEHPYLHLVELALSKKEESTEDGEDPVIDNIVSVLEDLEFHVGDVDMARDFHTLGGWAPLVSLLSSQVHDATIPSYNASITLTSEELETWIDIIQLNAAWVIGTAVKNTGEFFLYAVEPVAIRSDVQETSALRLLLEQFLETESTKKKKRQKFIYALGALLRGNHVAQLAFIEIEGHDGLARALEKEMLNDTDVALAKRILALMGDIVVDNETAELEKGDSNEKVIRAFASPSVCQSSLKSLAHSSRVLRETAVRTFQSLVPYCHDWGTELALSSMISVKKIWQVEPDLDPEIRRELLDLAVATIDEIRLQSGKT